MIDDNSRSRRRVLQLAGAGAVGTLTGCLGIFFGAEQPTVINDITFDGERVVVHLPDETTADAIEFRSPTDELLATASIGRTSTVAFSLHPATNRPRPPGEYTLVAVETGGSEPQRLDTRPLSLTSAVAVREIRPVSKSANGPSLPFEGKLQLTIKNTGTLPLRLTYIGFPSGVPSPHPAPSETSVRKQGYTRIAGTHNPIPIGETATFETEFAPLWTRGGRAMNGSLKDGAVGVPQQNATWTQVTRTHCNGEQYPATLLVIPSQGPTHRLTVTFKYAGQAARMGPRDTDYGCTNVSVVSVERTTTTATAATSDTERP